MAGSRQISTGFVCANEHMRGRMRPWRVARAAARRRTLRSRPVPVRPTARQPRRHGVEPGAARGVRPDTAIDWPAVIGCAAPEPGFPVVQNSCHPHPKAAIVCAAHGSREPAFPRPCQSRARTCRPRSAMAWPRRARPVPGGAATARGGGMSALADCALQGRCARRTPDRARRFHVFRTTSMIPDLAGALSGIQPRSGEP
jgi:hypothetical protein